MDDFREWLSDNLRYFMLGGGILLVVLVLVFGIRACTRSKKAKTGGTETVTEQQSVPQDVELLSDETDTETVEEESEGGDLSTANADVTQLITDYYNAITAADIDKLREISVDFSAEDEAKVRSDAQITDSYLISGISTKNGLTEGSYVAYITYDIIYAGYNSSVPMLSQMYIIQQDGRLKIDNHASSDPSISSYMDRLSSQEDVAGLKSRTEAQYQQVLQEDAELAGFLNNLGVAVSASPGGAENRTSEEKTDETADEEDTENEEETPTGPTVTTTDYANMRDSAGGESEVIDVIPTGTSVEVIEFDGLWVKVRYNGQEGYVYSELIYED